MFHARHFRNDKTRRSRFLLRCFRQIDGQDVLPRLPFGRCHRCGFRRGFGLLFAVAWIGELVFKKEAMGFGDVKLMGAIGAFLGWKAVIFTVFFSSLLGSICGLSLMAVKGAKLQSRIPFGPYLAAAAVVWIFWGPTLLRAYLSLAGGK